jgi:hypothetical protein
MTITLDLPPDIEQGLLVQAQAKGVSLTDFVDQLVKQQARQAPIAAVPDKRTGQALIDVCAEVRGLLTDEEIDTMFARNRSPSRSVDLS